MSHDACSDEDPFVDGGILDEDAACDEVPHDPNTQTMEEVLLPFRSSRLDSTLQKQDDEEMSHEIEALGRLVASLFASARSAAQTPTHRLFSRSLDVGLVVGELQPRVLVLERRLAEHARKARGKRLRAALSIARTTLDTARGNSESILEWMRWELEKDAFHPQRVPVENVWLPGEAFPGAETPETMKPFIAAQKAREHEAARLIYPWLPEEPPVSPPAWALRGGWPSSDDEKPDGDGDTHGSTTPAEATDTDVMRTTGGSNTTVNLSKNSFGNAPSTDAEFPAMAGEPLEAGGRGGETATVLFKQTMAVVGLVSVPEGSDLNDKVRRKSRRGHKKTHKNTRSTADSITRLNQEPAESGVGMTSL